MMIKHFAFLLILWTTSLTASSWTSDDAVINVRAKLPVIATEDAPKVQFYQMPLPHWVTKVTIPPIPDAKYTEDSIILLIDKQLNVDTSTEFHHVAKKLITAEGIRHHSSLEITFDPSFQTVTLHHIHLYRHGESVDYVATDDAYLIKTGNSRLWALTCLINDIREGDTLEYSYSVQGRHPSFHNYAVDQSYFQYPYSVERIFYRITGTEPCRINLKTHNVPVEPYRNQIDDCHWECVWNVVHVPPYQTEPRQPVWYQNAPWAQISEFADWSEVALWGNNLFRLPSTIPANLVTKTTRWMKAFPSPEQRALAAVRYVQDSLELEDMQQLHAPSDIKTILQKASGDTVDKAYLLKVLLALMDIDSTPAGVNASYRQVIDEWLPSPSAFDRILLRIKVNQTNYWVDPSQSLQGGDLNSNSCGLYKRALLFEPSSRGLTTLSYYPIRPQIESHVIYYLWPDQLQSSLLIETTLRDTRADLLRNTVKVLGKSALCHAFKSTYRELHGDLEHACEPDIEDDRARNIIVIREHYHIKNPWILAEKGRRKTLQLAPLTVTSELPTVQMFSRRLPMALEYPLHIIETVQVIAPDYTWEEPVRERQFLSQALNGRVKLNSSGDTLTLRTEVRTLTDYLAAAEVEEHAELMAELHEESRIDVDIPTQHFKTWDVTFPVLINLYMLLAIAFLAIDLRKHS